MTARELCTAWLARAEELAPYAPAAAEAFRRAAGELDAALRAEGDACLTLADAARESGLSPETLRHKIAAGELPNAGVKGRPRIRRADLPRRAARTASGYDPAADALSLHARRSAH